MTFSVIGGLFGVFIGFALIYSAYTHAVNCMTEIDKYKSLYNQDDRRWKKARGHIVDLGINMDQPDLSGFPKRKDFSSKEEFTESLQVFQQRIAESDEINMAFGGSKIVYRFETSDGDSVTARTIGFIPSPNDDRRWILNLSIGDQVTVFYPEDAPEQCVLRRTTDNQFQSYFNNLISSDYGKVASGAIIFSLGIGSILLGL